MTRTGAVPFEPKDLIEDYGLNELKSNNLTQQPNDGNFAHHFSKDGNDILFRISFRAPSSA